MTIIRETPRYKSLKEFIEISRAFEDAGFDIGFSENYSEFTADVLGALEKAGLTVVPAKDQGHAPNSDECPVMSVFEVAKLHQVHEHTVRAAIVSKALRGWRMGTVYVVARWSAELWRPRAAGRPLTTGAGLRRSKKLLPGETLLPPYVEPDGQS